MSTTCSHCGKAVKELKWLIDIYPGLNYRLIFAVYSGNSADKSNAVVSHLINLYKTMNKDEFFNTLDAWYSMPDKS